MIYTFIFSEQSQCANKTVEKDASKRCTFFLDDLNVIFRKKRGLRLKLSFNEENPII